MLTAQLAARGFVQARVTTAHRRPTRSGRSTLRFDVAAGRRARVGKVSIDAEGLSPRIRSELDVEDPAEIYDGPDIERQLDAVRTRLRRDGHYEASALVRPTPAGTSPAGDPLVDVAITIVPGPLVTLRFEGDPIPEARRAELVPVAREASVDEDLLEDSLRRIDPVPLPAGPLEGRRRLSPRRHAGRPRRDLHRHRRRGLPDRPRRRARASRR